MDLMDRTYSTSDRTLAQPSSTSPFVLPRISDPTAPTSLSPSAAPTASAVTLPTPTPSASSLSYKTAAPPSAPLPALSPHHNAGSTVMEVDNHPVAEDRFRRAASVLSMDDIEAAQALEGLRSDFGHSPRDSRQPHVITSPDPQQPEPLLSLLTSSHPLISSAINGSVSAYTTSKSYSSRFKSSAEFIERNIGGPVASTVGTVGRKTGVESGLRWALQRRESATADNKHSKKRRKVNGQGSETMDVEKSSEDGAFTSRRARSSSELSMAETLPPYDDLKSPGYEEKTGQQVPSTWQSRLVISTSGLGVAMSEESLRSLQYCLTWLRWANGRLGKAIVALQKAVSDWESYKTRQQGHDAENGIANGEASSSLLTQRIQAVKADVLSTLKQVVDVVSKYAGGALPENARHLVRRHLTSLPHRFQVASTSHPPPDSAAASSEATVGAHRILVLAQEGLDMMAQVSGVVNDTLVSAELWCDRLGRKRLENNRSNSDTPQEKQHLLPADHAGPNSQPYNMDFKQPLVPDAAPQEDVRMTGIENA